MNEPKLVRLGTLGAWAVEYGIDKNREKMFYGLRRDKHWLFRDVLLRKDMPKDFPTDEKELSDTAIALVMGFLAELYNGLNQAAVYERQI